MKEEWQVDRRPPGRRPLGPLVWAIAVVWSVYLVVVEVTQNAGAFAVAVRTLGSIGILYALFLVTRPKRRGVLEVLTVFREDVVPDANPEDNEPSSAAARWAIVTITVALAIGGFVYRLFQDNYLHQSAAFFIGVPAVLAITLALTPKAKSATGMIVKGMTLALLLSGVVFFEGIVCILMAAPLFYLVGIVIGIPIDRSRRRKQSEGKVYSVVGVGLLLLSFEGVLPVTSPSQQEVVTVTRTIDASIGDVRRALASSPVFDASLPFYLRLGFPRPVDAEGSGLLVGDRRTIFFGEESPMEPMDAPHAHDGHAVLAPPNALELEITKRAKGLVVFDTVADTTAMTHWIAWERSIVRWSAVDADTTEVTWTLRYRRLLSPSWYFAPWQRYAADKAVGYLIETVVTP